jgi:hypothetical protein
VVERLVSGGQTGVDRAALDVARELGLRASGYCPRGRKAEDGRIAETYPLEETPSPGYAQRTEWNVRDADGTLVLRRGPARGGTALTVRLARRLGRPLLVMDLASPRASPAAAAAWAEGHGLRSLNVAGPRESQAPGIYAEAARFLRAVLTPSRA